MVSESTEPTAARRLLAVHAHPDDETTAHGVGFPMYADQGVDITLVTCTLGEEGEVVAPELSMLSVEHADQLGGYRIWELREACAALGVTTQYFLGGPGRYRDSGMMGEASNDNPRCFWQADLDEAAGHLVQIIRDKRPQVMCTYNDFGGYGHPDHIQAHRVAMRAAQLAAETGYRTELGEPWAISKIYWGEFPRSALVTGLQMLKEMGHDDLFGTTDAAEAKWVCDDELITTAIDAPQYADRRMQAVLAHKTQIDPKHRFYQFLEMLGPVALREYYRLAHGTLGPVDPETGWETDLFAGL